MIQTFIIKWDEGVKVPIVIFTKLCLYISYFSNVLFIFEKRHFNVLKLFLKMDEDCQKSWITEHCLFYIFIVSWFSCLTFILVMWTLHPMQIICFQWLGIPLFIHSWSHNPLTAYRAFSNPTNMKLCYCFIVT